jgi:hypothetical protein
VATYWPSVHCVHSVQLPSGSGSTALLHWYAPGSLRFQNATPLVQLTLQEVPLARDPPRATHSPCTIEVLNTGSVQLAAVDK